MPQATPLLFVSLMKHKFSNTTTNVVFGTVYTRASLFTVTTIAPAILLRRKQVNNEENNDDLVYTTMDTADISAEMANSDCFTACSVRFNVSWGKKFLFCDGLSNLLQ
jgi:hypothetical protein